MNDTAGPLLLTEEEIMSPQHFGEAVLRGGMDQKHYVKLCAMARACLQMLEGNENDEG